MSAAEVNTLLEFYRREGRKTEISTRYPAGVGAHLVAPRSVPIEEEPATSHRVRSIASATSSSPRAVVLPVEQHPGRGAAGSRDQRAVARSADVAQQVKRMLADDRADALVDNFAGQGCICASWKLSNRGQGLRRRTCAARPARDRDDLRRDSSAMDRSLLDPSTRLHVRRRAARPPLRHPECQRQLLPPRVAARDSPRRGLLGQGSVLTVTSTATRTLQWCVASGCSESARPPAPVQPPAVETDLGGEEGNQDGIIP